MALEVTRSQFTALMRGEAVTIGPSKRVITLEDGPFEVRHYGPGTHPGTGTPQEVHGQGGVRADIIIAPNSPGYIKTLELRQRYDSIAEAKNSEYWHKEYLHSSHHIFENIPKTARWDAVRNVLDSIDEVHGVDTASQLPLKETKAKSKGGSYHTVNEEPLRFMVKLEDSYGEGTEISLAHEIGHHIDHWLLTQDEPYGMMWMMETVSAYFHHDSEGQFLLDDITAAAYDDLTFDRFGHYGDEEIAAAAMELYRTIDQSDYRQNVLKNFKPKPYLEIETPPDYFYGGPAGRERERPKYTHATLPKIRVQQSIENYHIMLRPRELFARAYSQYIALRSQNQKMMTQVNEGLTWAKHGGTPNYWEWEDFQPVAEAFDNLFRSKRWLKP
jgi:hypothetical protein